MEQHKPPVADRYMGLDRDVRTTLTHLHGHAATHFQHLERDGHKPVRGVLRSDFHALDDTRGLEHLPTDPIDIARLFNLDRRYRRNSTNITLGVDHYTDPETEEKHFEIYATKEYDRFPQIKKLGAFVARRAAVVTRRTSQLTQRFLQR